MDLLKYSVLNDSDIKDFIVSFDRALKIRLEKEGFLESRYIPKILLGEDRSYEEQSIQTPYERPFVTFNLERRGPASLSDTNFFTGMLQHKQAFEKKISEGISEKVLYRDNEFKLVVRAKTKNEIYFLLQILERVIVLEEGLLDCNLVRFIESKDLIKTQNDLYVANFIFRARTTVVIRVDDDAVLSKVNITYKNKLCKYYNIMKQKCDYHDLFGSLPTCQDYDPEVHPPVCKPIGASENAQREEEASDINCYIGTDWCSEHEDKSKIAVKG